MPKPRKIAEYFSKKEIFISQKVRHAAPIFGVPVDSTSKEEVLRVFLQFLESEAKKGGRGSSKKLVVATPNPEILVLASKNLKYKAVLQSTSINIPDGIGVVMAQKFLSAKADSNKRLTTSDLVRLGLKVGSSFVFNRKWLFSEGAVVPGRVVFEHLAHMAGEKGWKIFLLGGADGVAKTASRQLISNFKFPISNQFQIIGESGPWLDAEGRPKDAGEEKVEEKTIEKINKFKPDILFVGFGHPKQEFWVARNLKKLNVRAAMVVGGSFDYTAGIVPVPPRWVSGAGFEWFFRLITQPWRVGRIATAVFIFPWKVFRSSF